LNLGQYIAQQQALKEERDDTMTATTDRDRIFAAYRTHGPMTTRQLRKHVPGARISMLVAQLANSSQLGRLGGTKCNTIYGLPDQHAPVSAPDKPPRSIHRKRRQRAGGGTAMHKRRVKRMPKLAKPRAATRKALPQSAGAFRPAIAADGALLFIGAAKGDFELNRAEVRVLAEFLRRVDRTGARA